MGIGGRLRRCSSFGFHWWAAPRARRGLGLHALAAHARARSGGTATPPGGAGRAARRRLRVPDRGGAPRRQGAADVRPGRLDARPLHQPPHACCTTCSTRPPACASSRCCAAPSSSSRATPSCSGRWPTRRPTVASTSGRVVVFTQAAVGAAIDRVRRAQLGPRRGIGPPAAAVLPSASGRWRPVGDAGAGRASRSSPAGLPSWRFRDVTFAYRGMERPVLRRLRPDDPGRLLAGHRRPERRRQDHAGQAPLPPVRPHRRGRRGGRRRPARPRPRAPGGRRSPRCSRTSSASSCRCATTSPPPGPRTTSCSPRWQEAGAGGLADLDTAAVQGLRGRHRPLRRPVAAGGPGPGAVRGAAGRRAWCSSTSRRPSSTSAGRPRSSTGSSRATRHCTTILVSHRFSTVRQADRICVLEHGRVVELGTHDELMAARRPLPHDVRPAGAAVRGRRRGRGGGP